MLKKRIIPILTFNGFQLVKTKKFSNPRTIGNPIQSARVFNSRNVDELVFIDIYATKQKRKVNLNLVKKIIDECLEVLNRKEVKREFKKMMAPLIELLLKDIYPYIYLSVIFVVLSFLLILGIFILLVRNKCIN